MTRSSNIPTFCITGRKQMSLRGEFVATKQSPHDVGIASGLVLAMTEQP